MTAESEIAPDVQAEESHSSFESDGIFSSSSLSDDSEIKKISESDGEDESEEATTSNQQDE